MGGRVEGQDVRDVEEGPGVEGVRIEAR